MVANLCYLGDLKNLHASQLYGISMGGSRISRGGWGGIREKGYTMKPGHKD